jgi:polyhydroxybutyrate depolymerase
MTTRILALRGLGVAAALLGLAGAGQTEEAAPTCDPARPFAAGLSEHRLVSGGQERGFLLHLPGSYDGETALPLVFDLHASGISPAVELAITGLDRAAEARGFPLVLPVAVTPFPSGGATWNIPRQDGGVDDVAFVADVLEAVSGMLCIDPARVYAAGFSGGARLASELACTLPERFAAISAVGGLRHPAADEGHCAKGGAVSILAFHSSDDLVNPFDPEAGRAPPYWSYGIEEAMRRWAGHKGCELQPVAHSISAQITRLTHDGCADGAALELYRLSGSGHTWPGSDFTFPDPLGATEEQLDATALTVEFFQRVRLPPG